MQEANDKAKNGRVSQDPACKATQEALLQIDIINVMSDCPACFTVGTRCLVAFHPSAAAMTGK